MGRSSSAAAFGKWLRETFPGVPPWVFIVGVVTLVVGFIALSEWLTRRQRNATPYFGVSVSGEDDLHLIERGAVKPKGILLDLRGFKTAEEVYHYVFEQFEEPAFKNVFVHRQGTEPAQFVRQEGADRAAHIAALERIMFGEAAST